MSEHQQGPAWWQASDGRWYPPETHPDYAPPQAEVAPSASLFRRPVWSDWLWWCVVVAIPGSVVAANLVMPPDDGQIYVGLPEMLWVAAVVGPLLVVAAARRARRAQVRQ